MQMYVSVTQRVVSLIYVLAAVVSIQGHPSRTNVIIIVIITQLVTRHRPIIVMINRLYGSQCKSVNGKCSNFNRIHADDRYLIS